MTRRAADLLVDCLAAHGVERIFCVPGESYLGVLDALADRNDVATVVCRHEGGAGFMALADGKLTGEAGVAFVSRGPGATNASIAVHIAEQDAAPLVLFIGQVSRGERGRRAFQEVDYAKTFSDMAKAVWTIEDARRIPEIVAKAFAVAEAPTPGPVVVALPEDMLLDVVAAAPLGRRPAPRASAPSADVIADVATRLAAAERPLVIAGGRLSSDAGRAALVAAAEAHSLPVAPTFKRDYIFPRRHPCFAGHLGFKIPQAQVELFSGADLVLAVGTRLGEASTQGYAFPAAPAPCQPLIHVTDDPAMIGREHVTALPLVADPAAFLAALAQHPARKPPPGRAAWVKRLHDVTRRALAWSPPADGLLDMGAVVAAFEGLVAEDAIFTTDAGNFSGWLHRHFPFGPGHVALGSIGGGMGLGVPAAVAAALRFPRRQVIALIGDGGALMTGSEIATAIQFGARMTVFVSNNGSFGTIRQHQEREFPGRVSGTALRNPDFAAWARSFGALGLTLDRIKDAPRVVAAALAHDGVAVVDVKTAVEHISAAGPLPRS